MTDWIEHDGGPQPVWDAWVMYRQDPHRLFPTKLGALRKGDFYRILNQHLIDAARLEGIRLGLEVAAREAEIGDTCLAEVKCVNAHDRCFEGGPCPLCEVVRYRDEQGRFAKTEEADQ